MGVMSHFNVNKKTIDSIMNDERLSPEEKEDKVYESFHDGIIRGGKDMMKKTYNWMCKEYENQLSKVKLYYIIDTKWND